MMKQKSFDIFHFGADYYMRPIFIPNINQHLSVFGGSGSGKSVFLFNLLMQICKKGGGSAFIDGKGDINMLQDFLGFAKKYGRLDDVLILNFNVNNDDEEPISNTFNIFKSLELGDIETVISQISLGKVDDFFKQQTQTYLKNIFMILHSLKDNGQELNLKILLKTLNLKSLLVNLIPASMEDNSKPDSELLTLNELTEYEKFWVPKNYYLDGTLVWESIKNLVEGYGGKIWRNPEEKETDITMGKTLITEELQRQLGGYSSMYIKVIEGINNKFNDIFNSPKNDINFEEVIAQNKLLYVVIPSMNLSEAEKDTIGAFIISSIKNAIAKSLGTKAGTSNMSIFEMFNKEERTSNPKFLLVLDEMAAYFSKAKADIGEILAQARSVNIGCVISSQDVASLAAGEGGMNFVDKALGNCYTKIFLRTTDQQTLDKLKSIIIDVSKKYDEQGNEIKADNLEIESWIKTVKNGYGVIASDGFSKFLSPFYPIKPVKDFYIKS